MKIAFVFPPNWTPHSDGSLQIWNREVTTRLAKSCDVLVYSGLQSFKAHDIVDGVRYRRFSPRWDNRFLKRFQILRKAFHISGPLFSSDLWYLGYALRVAWHLRRHHRDIVHVYNYPQFAAVIKWFNPTTRVVLNMHGEILTQLKFRNLASRLKRFDLIVSCSDLITGAVRQTFPSVANLCKTLPMGITPEVFSGCLRSEEGERATSRRILHVGRLSPEKGVHVLVEAFNLIVRQVPDASLTIVGPEWIAPRADYADLCLSKETMEDVGQYFQGSYLEHLARKVSPDAAGKVHFAGLIPHSQVHTLYENADIYVAPGFYESFGMSIIEAMAAGVPVVACRGGAVPEIVSDGRTGLLVDVGDPPAIAQAVIRLFSDPGLCNSISDAARRMVFERYSWDTIASKLLRFYGEVLRVGSANQPEEAANEIEAISIPSSAIPTQK
jgi:glycosyltransferase involved in cell wall biosynthesis